MSWIQCGPSPSPGPLPEGEGKPNASASTSSAGGALPPSRTRFGGRGTGEFRSPNLRDRGKGTRRATTPRQWFWVLLPKQKDLVVRLRLPRKNPSPSVILANAGIQGLCAVVAAASRVKARDNGEDARKKQRHEMAPLQRQKTKNPGSSSLTGSPIPGSPAHRGQASGTSVEDDRQRQKQNPGTLMSRHLRAWLRPLDHPVVRRYLTCDEYGHVIKGSDHHTRQVSPPGQNRSRSGI